MHPKRARELDGVRFAFAQGGRSGTRLVYLSPPVSIVAHRNVTEALWEPSKPFRYELAPLLINGEGKTNFPKLKKSIEDARNAAWVSKFASRYRSCRAPLVLAIAQELIRNFLNTYTGASDSLIETYEEALPFPPPKVDRNRKKTYKDLLLKARFIA